MIKIMFVCHGNICRSPMAEFIFKDLLAKTGRTIEFSVSSSATSSEEIVNGKGMPIYHLAKIELAKHHISCDGKNAVQLKAKDYNYYDYFICMDDYNIANALKIFKGDPLNKVRKLQPNQNIFDPCYTGKFDIAFEQILTGCKLLLYEFEK